MDCCAGKHGVIVTFFLTLKLGLWHCQEAEVSPILLEIRSDPLHQRLLVEWIFQKIYESHIDIKFHIQVARSDKKNIIANEYLTPDLPKSHMTFRWTWDSQLPFECDSHSVRIRNMVEGNWGEWSPWKTLPGENKERANTKIYPFQRVVPEGSDVTFCCLPGRDQTILEMTYGREKKERELYMGTETYVISVQNVTRTSAEGVNVQCKVTNMKKGDFTPGTVLIVTRLPDDPEYFSCETQDLQTLRCKWNPGAKYNFYGTLQVTYTLQEWFSLKSKSCSRDHCDWPIEKNQQMYNFTLTARNQIGEKSINARVHLNQRVLLKAPTGLSAEYVNASSIRLNWYLKADYTSLQILCQVDLQKDLEHKVNMTSGGKRPISSYGVDLSGLQAYTQYNLGVRCMAASSLAGWSNWSNLVVRTSEDVPSGSLDVWRSIEDNEKGRTVTLYWRPLPLFRANGNISHYTIKKRPLEGASVEEEISVSGVNYSKISIGRQAYSISVTAHNTVGGSPPAELMIPASAASGTEQMAAKRTNSKDGGIFISWRQKEDLYGYVVEWCAVPRSSYCDVRWKKYNSTIHNDIIRSGDFSPGVRYYFRIYGSMKDGEHLLEKMTGYIEEQASVVAPVVKISKIEPTSIFLDWSPYPTDDSQKGFVIGYNVYVRSTERNCNLEIEDEDRVQLGGFHMCKFYIDDPNKMQMTINELKPNGHYEVAVVAVTGGGEARAEFHKVNTPSDTGAALRSIIVPIMTVAALALVLLFLGCWKRVWLKKICLPDIPDPNKSKIFSFNGTKGILNGHILPTTNREPQMVDSVSIQENKQRKTYEEANATPEHQLHEMYATLPTREGSECDNCSESYIPYDHENSSYSQANDPSYNSQPLPYLQFFNNTYRGTLHYISDDIQGYRPQTNTAQVHCPPYAKTSVKPESGLDDEPVICFSGPDYGTEPMSPTSVGSSTLIIVD